MRNLIKQDAHRSMCLEQEVTESSGCQAVSGGASVWRCRERVLNIIDGPLVMGILNVTPDSFSDGGRFFNPESAVARGLEMAAAGADIIDVGGESTRPGAAEVPVEEELRRILPVISALARQTDCVISVDTTKSAVAGPALDAGAHIVNDISAMTADPEMPELARRYNAGVILMHRQGTPATMQDNPCYRDVTLEVGEYLKGRLAAVYEAGLSPETTAIDPGIGFGKTTRHNLQLLAHLEFFRQCGRPLVIGLSRKRFLGEITGRKVEERQAATLSALAFTIPAGVGVLRVHDVPAARDAVLVFQALQKERCSR